MFSMFVRIFSIFPYHTFDINKPIDFHATDKTEPNVHTQNFMSLFVRYIIILFNVFEVSSIYVCTHVLKLVYFI